MSEGRYALYEELGAGGMAQVHLGRLRGAAGFARTVVLKRLHAHLAKDPEFSRMFVDEARLASRIRHPNVVSTLDVISENGVILIVMEYVHGESLQRLLHDAKEPPAPAIAVALAIDLLEGLHAAHEARTERGEALEMVHRDVSPQNILVGDDGVARVLDFGIAKAAHRLTTTGDNVSKGKSGYMAPEQVLAEDVDCRADVFAAGVVLWETLVGQSLFQAATPAGRMMKVLSDPVPTPNSARTGVPEAVDAIVMRALSRERKDRFQTAKAMAEALEAACTPARRREVAAWVETIAGPQLRARADLVAKIERMHVQADAEGTLAAVNAADPPERGAPAHHDAEPTRAEGSLRPRRKSPVAIVVAVVVVAVGLLAFGLGAIAARRTASRPIDPPSATTPTAGVPPDREPMVAADDRSSSSSTLPSPRPPATGSTTATVRRGQMHGPRPVPAPRCVPPYTVREDGIHVPKPECLHTP